MPMEKPEDYGKFADPNITWEEQMIYKVAGFMVKQRLISLPRGCYD